MPVEMRPWTTADAAWYAEATKDPEIQRFTSDPPTLTESDVAAAISRLAGDAHAVSFLITDGPRRCGNVAAEIHDGVGEVSYFVAATARRRGVATAALTGFVEWIFANRPVDELRLWTHADNTGSRRVAERAGFARDPDRDGSREVKGAAWPTVAYRLLRR